MDIVAYGALLTWFLVRFVWYSGMLTPPSSLARSPRAVDSLWLPVPS